jgi:flavodoxin
MKKIMRLLKTIFILSILVQFTVCATAPVAPVKTAPSHAALKKIETGKKLLVAYFSKTGNTERVAMDIAWSLDADIDKIQDKKDRKGFCAWWAASTDSIREKSADIEPFGLDPSKYDVVLIGSPVWAWNMTPAVRMYIEQNKSRFKEVAFFITAGSTTAEKVVPIMEGLSGKKAVAYIGFVKKDLKDENIYGGKLAKFLEIFRKPNS